MTLDQALAAAGVVSTAIFGCLAFAFAWYTASRGNRNSSAANLISLSEALRESIARYSKAEQDTLRASEMTNLINLLETACVVLLDRGIHGRARELIRKLVADLLVIILKNDELRAFMATLRDEPTTFRNIYGFVHLLRRKKEYAELQKFLKPDGSFDPTI